MNRIMSPKKLCFVFLRQFPACKGRSSSYITKNITVIPWCMRSNVNVISCIDMCDHDPSTNKVTARNRVQVNYSDFCIINHQLRWVTAIAGFSHGPCEYINAGLRGNKHTCWGMVSVSIVGFTDIKYQSTLTSDRGNCCWHVCVKGDDFCGRWWVRSCGCYR